MMDYRIIWFSIFMLMVVLGQPRALLAQNAGSRVVEIRTNMPDAIVYADSVYLGRASDKVFNLPPDALELRLVPTEIDSWALSPLVADLTKEMGARFELDMFFKYYYSIESIPYEAQVFLETPGERTLLGDTPLLHVVDDPIRGMLLVTKSGYEPLHMTPGDKIWNQHYVTLEETKQGQEIAESFWRSGHRSSRWVNYVAGGVAIASGVLAIHFKNKADNRYAVYELTGDPTLRPTFERYDRFALMSLGAMQVGVGVLAIRLVLN